MSEIGGREGISEKYLGQIMLGLRSAKLVEAHRGSQGGYFLARAPASISVLDLVIALDGEALEPFDSDESTSSGSRDTDAMAGEAWTRLRASMEQSLKVLSLEDLVKIALSKDAAGDFSI
jgi:Rrf2 family protein